MTAHDRAAHGGSTELTFTTSLGSAVEGLRYRIRDSDGNTWSGVTGAGGNGVTIGSDALEQESQDASFWKLNGGSVIYLEVLRDDGTWKSIGAFEHDGRVRKKIRVIAGAVAMPFQMDAV